MILKLENISFSYQNNHLLESINLSISAGEFTCLIGPNGIGKSTLLKLIMGELKPDKGEINFDSDNTCEKLRIKNISYLPSEIPDPLYITVGELVKLARFDPDSIFNSNLTPLDKSVIESCIYTCNLSNLSNALRAAISGALPFEELSSGEKQRAWLAFALAQDRKILVLDESINSLDHENTDMFFRILKKVSSDGKAILMCTHNLEMVSKYADNLLILKDKTITYEGPSKQNLSQMIYS